VGADEAHRLHQMGRARRRLGCRRHHRPRGHAARGASRHSPQHPVRLSRADTRHLVTRAALRRGHPRPLHRRPRRVEPPAGHEAGDGRIRPGGFARRPGSLDLREVPVQDRQPRARLDDMLDAISLYWFTNSAASSARIYWENKSLTFAGPKLTLPVAVTVFPKDIPRLPRSWIEDTYGNLILYGEASKGGHFAALEQPDILVSEIRTGLRTLRS